MCERACTHIVAQSGGQKIAFQSWFSPSTFWAAGMKQQLDWLSQHAGPRSSS